MPNPKHPRHPRGVTLIETIIGLTVAAVAIAAAGSAMSQYRHGSRQLQTTQNLKAHASAALMALRAGQPPALAEGHTLEILSQSPASNAPNRLWVQIRIKNTTQSAELWGLIPQSALQNTQNKAP